MYKILCLTITVLAVVLVSLPTNGWAQVPATQIQLTEKNVEGFIAAQKDMSALVEKMRGVGAVFLKRANGKYKVERDAITKKYGFRDFAEYDAVANNISLVITAIDPQTRDYADPQTAIKKEIDDEIALRQQHVADLIVGDQQNALPLRDGLAIAERLVAADRSNTLVQQGRRRA
jgi:hypothetical protein